MSAIFTASLFLPFFVHASHQNTEKASLVQGGKVVYIENQDCLTMVFEGGMAASQGHSIRLRPGTHIIAVDESELRISIVSQEHYQDLVKEATEKKEERIIAFISEKRDNGDMALSSIRLDKMQQHAPSNRSYVRQQLICLVGLRVRSTDSPNPSILHSLPSLTKQYFSIYHPAPLSPRHIPSRAWGDSAENIRVMLS